MPDQTILIAEMFRGPPQSGNGGYVAGVVAAVMSRGALRLPGEGAVEVTLRAPTPLDRPLTVHRTEHSLAIKDDAMLIAEAKVVTLQLDIPAAASWDEALSAREQSYSFPVGLNTLFATSLRGVHPICFCCGVECAPTAGAHVYSAPIEHKQQVAAAWMPNECWADARGYVRPEIIWTALDCPGQMAWRAEGVVTGMLGRITARVVKDVRVGERCVVIGWTVGSEGKKYFAGTALLDQAGELCAYAKAVWIGRWN